MTTRVVAAETKRKNTIDALDRIIKALSETLTAEGVRDVQECAGILLDNCEVVTSQDMANLSYAVNAAFHMPGRNARRLAQKHLRTVLPALRQMREAFE